MSVNADLKTGIDLVTKATDHDTNARYSEAVYLYNLGLDFLHKSSQTEYNEQTKQLITQKISQYSVRLQQLKDALSKPQATKAATPAPAPTATTKPTTPLKNDIPSFTPVGTPISTPASTLTAEDIRKLNLNDKPKTEVMSAPPQVDWSALQATEKAKARQSEVMTAPPQIDWAALQAAEKEKMKSYVGGGGESKGDIFSELDRAMKLIEKATVEDSAKRYESALTYYREALDVFLRAIENESSPDIKKAVTERMTIYLERAEQIKGALRGTQRGTTKEAPQPKPAPAPKQPQKAEVSATASGFVQAAIDTATQAIEEDECGRFAEAVEKYDQALQLFTAALQTETNEPVRAIIKEKMVSYNSRSEQLKIYIASGSTNPIPTSLKPGEKYKPPEMKKKSSGLFSKKEKKTWD